MDTTDLITARKKAEEAIEGMSDGPLKVKAFEVILTKLLSGHASLAASSSAEEGRGSRNPGSSSLAGRIDALAEEGFFGEPRSLSEIQNKLAEHGWHYPQTNLSSPLIRFVRQRKLRRLPAVAGAKRVWKYSLP